MALARILCPIYSDPSPSFEAALWIALANRARLFLLQTGAGDKKAAFPSVRETLARWRLMSRDEPPQAIHARLGVVVTKSSAAGDFEHEVVQFAGRQNCDLIVLQNEQRSGLGKLLPGVRRQDFSRAISMPTLFVPTRNEGFVNEKTGQGGVGRVLLALENDANAQAALRRIERAIAAVDPRARIDILHVGALSKRAEKEAEARFGRPILIRDGSLVDTIVATARELGSDIITVPSFGRGETMDAIRGSVTERVLTWADCAVLAVPVR